MDNRIPGVQGDSRESHQSTEAMGQSLLLLQDCGLSLSTQVISTGKKGEEMERREKRKGEDYYNI